MARQIHNEKTYQDELGLTLGDYKFLIGKKMKEVSLNKTNIRKARGENDDTLLKGLREDEKVLDFELKKLIADSETLKEEILTKIEQDIKTLTTSDLILKLDANKALGNALMVEAIEKELQERDKKLGIEDEDENIGVRQKIKRGY